MRGSRVLVTGAAGQDGVYLVAELVRRGCHVFAGSRSPAKVTPTSPEVVGTVQAIALDVTQIESITHAVKDLAPDLIFNLAARSSGRGMFDDPIGGADVNGMAVMRLLEAVRLYRPGARLCQASSSEVFGQPMDSPQTELSTTRPRSPYGVAKLYADHMVQLYRQHFGLFACSAILFNHESPLRRVEFVTRKVTRAAAAIKLGLETSVELGDLEARRDWGFAGDYMRGMALMLTQTEPRDCVLATGETRSVRDLCAAAFSHVGLDYQNHVRSDSDARRAPESMQLVGDASRARKELGWNPTLSFAEIIQMMVDADLQELKSQPRH